VSEELGEKTVQALEAERDELLFDLLRAKFKARHLP
jgi:ribosomal protein L29